MQERLGIEEAIHQAGLDAMSLNVIESPLQFVRDTLDLLPTDTDDDWAAIGAYLGAVPQAMQEWHASLTHAAAQGLVASRRQVEGVLTQIDDLVAPDGTLAQLAKQGRDASPAAAQQLDDGIAAAVRGYGEARMWLVADILPRAGTIDAVGRDEYEMYSRRFLGTDIDVEETYAWGLAELERIQAEMSAVGARILPGATMPEVFAHLDADPRYAIEGTDALRTWMQGRADEAVAELSGSHFDIPEPVRRIECRIAPSTTGGIYYTGPRRLLAPRSHVVVRTQGRHPLQHVA